jgi:hypothetical protein
MKTRVGGFPRLRLPNPAEILVGELAEPGDWVVAYVETTSYWPVKTQKANYRGRTIWVLPIMEDRYPAVATRVSEGDTRVDCELLLARFLSSLAWVQQRGFLIDGFGGGSRLFLQGGRPRFGISVTEEFDLSYFPEPADGRVMLALALMREGWGLNHPAYAFLSFYRVLEVALPDGKKRGSWIDNSLTAIADYRTQQAFDDLQERGIVDIATHLRDSGRHAIAHARGTPVVDPDDPTEYRRLARELPIIEALARRAVEEVLGVETPHTVRKKHLYELAGFKEIFGPELVDLMVRGEKVEHGRMVNIPRIDVRLRRREPYAPLSNLMPLQLGQDGSLAFIRFGSDDGTVRFDVTLDFANERLVFDLFNDIAVLDTGTAEAAERLAEFRRFAMEYFGNGQLHIYDAEAGSLISRKDAFIPENMFLNHEVAEAEIAKWKLLSWLRLGAEPRFDNELRRLSTPYAVEELKVSLTSAQWKGKEDANSPPPSSI